MQLSSCRAVDADQAVNAGIASLTCCQLSTSIHRLALHPAGYCSQLWWWIRGLSAWIAPPFLLGPTLETIKIRTDNDLLQRAALGRSLAKTHQFLAHTQIITKIFALEAGSLRNPYSGRKTQSLFSVFCFHRPSQIRFQLTFDAISTVWKEATSWPKIAQVFSAVNMSFGKVRRRDTGEKQNNPKYIARLLF